MDNDKCNKFILSILYSLDNSCELCAYFENFVVKNNHKVHKENTKAH